ncbi:MAG: N-acetyl-alpha-D-glucosaminyl L-malate synthase BshA [Fibrobacteria bacterium]|nr:N-acetyl-alpha-D-glucosaminyl L-malate synthase BshA [Fibrobacteria bacterium]
MKIGITCYPTYGGSGVLATELGKLLAKRGHEVHFITSALPYRLHVQFEERVFFHEVEMDKYPLLEYSPYDLALAAKMREIFLSEKLDLLHVHYALPHAISAFLAAKMIEPAIMPVVTTLHGTDITIVGQKKSFYDITRLGINQSTIVTAVSEYLTKEAEDIFIPEKPIRTIHNFVDLQLFKKKKKSSRRCSFATENQIVYTHISNFRKVKRIPDVVKIFSRIVQDVDGILLMVGEGPLLSDARQLVESLGISDKVKFLGKQEDVVSIFSMSDIFLFPSETESFGLAALEAMACEVPVIASRSGGIPEVVNCGETGFLSETGDVTAMAINGIKLGKNSDLRLKMGKAGRKRAKQYFGPDKIIPLYEKVYQEAVELAHNCNQ